MGIYRLPHLCNYWSRDSILGVLAIRQYVLLNRFWAIWSDLHVVDNAVTPVSGGLSFDAFSATFLNVPVRICLLSKVR